MSANTLLAAATAAMLVLGLVACDKPDADASGKGPMEQAGEKADAAASRAGEALNEAGQKAGQAIQSGGEKLEGAAQEAQKKE